MDFLIENGVLIKVIDPEPSVIIPDLVRIIGSEAFLGCENITDVVILYHGGERRNFPRVVKILRMS